MSDIFEQCLDFYSMNTACSTAALHTPLLETGLGPTYFSWQFGNLSVT